PAIECTYYAAQLRAADVVRQRPAVLGRMQALQRVSGELARMHEVLRQRLQGADGARAAARAELAQGSVRGLRSAVRIIRFAAKLPCGLRTPDIGRLSFLRL